MLTGTSTYLLGYDALKMWVESPAGQKLASNALGKSIKVYGQFAPFTLDGWTLKTPSFTSKGWPGEVIGSLDATNVRAEYNIGAIWQGAYKINGIQMDQAEITIIPPDNKLKLPVPPKKPRPWYAYFLPSRFECGPMICPDTKLNFSFQGQTAHLQHAYVQADLIGKNLQYTANSGILDFSYLPQMRVDWLKLLVTRPTITIYGIDLAGVDPNDPARLHLDGWMGQHEDKTIQASVNIVQLPIEQILPTELAPLIHGRATGKLYWFRDYNGNNIYSQGEINLNGASITDLSVFKQLAMLHGNPDLQSFVFDELTCKFVLKDGVFTAELVAKSAGKFSISGTIKYELKTKFADLDLVFGDLPLKTWLPSEFKPRISGMAKATMKWRGHLNTIKDSSGEVTLNLDGTYIKDPVLLRKMVESKGLRAPDDLYFKTAQMDVTYQEQSFTLKRGEFELPGILTATMTGTLKSPENILDADVTWDGLATQNWLPQLVSNQFSGDINGHAKLHVENWKISDGTYGGDIALTHGEVRNTAVQFLVARFLDDRSLLTIPLNQASFNWSWANNQCTVEAVDLRGADKIGMQGRFSFSATKQLSGTIWVGTKPLFLRSLCGLADNVFSRHDAGLAWAKVKLSGTLKEPQQDLTGQLMAQIPSHPEAVFGLSAKIISWYVGNLLGADEEWKATQMQTLSKRTK